MRNKSSIFIIVFVIIIISVSFTNAAVSNQKAFPSPEILFSSLINKVEKLFTQISGQKQLAQAAGSEGVRFTVDKFGLQSLSYNGLSFVTAPSISKSTTIVPSALFVASDGTKKPYGWMENSLDKNLSVGSSQMSSGTNPDYFEQIYRKGKADSFTVKMVWTTPDSRTAKADIYVTNNDQADTLKLITLEYFLGAGNFTTPDLASSHPLWLMLGSDDPNSAPVAHIPGNDWGSIAMFTDNYNNHATFFDVWTHPSGSQANPKFLFNLRNFSNPGGAETNAKVDPILPGQTFHYALFIRFGSKGESLESLAPEAFTAYRNTFPYLVNWPDRRPIARWFIGNGQPSELNPRSYLWDAKLDVSDQEKFTSKLLTTTDQIVTRMNAMNPKPQGILIWDLEGDEFNHYLTYVGNPNKLRDLAPEMDAAADQMFKKLADAGYKTGITLRPSNFQTGTTLPGSCASGGSNRDLNDVFIKTDAKYPNRGYACTAPNVWTQPGARNPSYQTCSWDDATILNNLSSKVSYAKNRWGVKLFYVDSTVYCSNGGGMPFNFTIMRDLQRQFPDVIFFPENEVVSWWGSSAPYNQVNMGVYETSSLARMIYPQAFSVLANFDGVNFDDAATRSRLIRSVKDGNIFMIDGWWNNPINKKTLQIYRDAGFGSPAGNSTPPTVPAQPTMPVVTDPAIVPVTPAAPAVTAPAVVAGVCSNILNRCSSGSFIDNADTASAYLWSCAGSNGGNTVLCSFAVTNQTQNTVQVVTTIPPNQTAAKAPAPAIVIPQNTLNSIVPLSKTYNVAYLPPRKVISISDEQSSQIPIETKVIDVTVPRIPSWIEFLKTLIFGVIDRIGKGMSYTVKQFKNI